MTTLAASLLLATAIGASGQERPAPSYTFERIIIGDYDWLPTGVAQLSTGVIAVSGFNGNAHTDNALSSTDGGETWTNTFLDEPLSGIVAFGDRFFAVGEAPPNSEESQSGIEMASRIWSSADGITWDHIATLDNANIESLAVTPDGLAALGAEHRTDDGSSVVFPPGYPTLWTSQDGIDWIANEISAPLPVAPPQPDESFWAFSMQGPVRSEDGVWLAGATYQPIRSASDSAIVWRSPDGVQWDVVMEREDSEIIVLAETPAGFVMVMAGGEDEIPTLTSNDGIEWEPSSERGDLESGAEAVVSDAAGPFAIEAPDINPFESEDISGIEVPVYRFSEDTGWEAVDSGIVDGWVHEAAVAPDGRLLLAG